jgi:release factor glutamine methyltransferase
VADYNTLDESVTKWEDYHALVANNNGFELIEKIIAQAPAFIQTNNEMKHKNIPNVIIEIGHTQSNAVQEIMSKAGYNNILVHKDLEGKDRFITARTD